MVVTASVGVATSVPSGDVRAADLLRFAEVAMHDAKKRQCRGAIGLVMEGTSQAIAFVAASIIAPGFEPIAKIPMGLALRRWDVARTGLKSAGVG